MIVMPSADRMLWKELQTVSLDCLGFKTCYIRSNDYIYVEYGQYASFYK